MKEHLKIKILSLAAEARIIRHQEVRARNDARRITKKRGPGHSDVRNEIRQSLYLHRINVVRRECRTANLAYGFLRGTPYIAMERKAHSEPDWSGVLKMICRFSNRKHTDVWPEMRAWMDKSNVSATAYVAYFVPGSPMCQRLSLLPDSEGGAVLNKPSIVSALKSLIA